MMVSVFTWVKLPVFFPEQFYGPIAGALARKNNSLVWGLQNVSFDLVSKRAH